jgi:hypothetical protein
MQKIIYILTLTFGIFLTSFGQTATIIIKGQAYYNSYKNFDSIYFDFNGTKFWGKDTFPIKIKLNDNFDKCTYIIGNDTFNFLTKFQSGQKYVLEPGSLNVPFKMLVQAKATIHGTVTFKNNSDKDLGITVCNCDLYDNNSDTVKSGSQKTIFSKRSINQDCFVMPCRIQIVETPYLSQRYSFRDDEKDYRRLWKEQEKYLLNQVWFQFLHGEKLEIAYDTESNQIELEIMGLLTDSEIDEIQNKRRKRK